MDYVYAGFNYLQNSFRSVDEDPEVVSELTDSEVEEGKEEYIPQERISFMQTNKQFPKLIIDRTISFIFNMY